MKSSGHELFFARSKALPPPLSLGRLAGRPRLKGAGPVPGNGYIHADLNPTDMV